MTASLRTLRPHQVAGIDGIKASIMAGQLRPILAAPTGYGKTEVAAHLIADARDRNKRIVFCVPTIGLVDQTFERFVANGFDPSDMGVIQASHPWRRPHAPIQIATGQTLAKRERPIVDEVIIDEAHQLQQTYRDWITDPEWAQVPFIGMTATPGTKGLGKYFTNLVKPIALTDLIDQRYLVPMKVFAPSKPNLEGVRTVGDDYNQGDLADRMNKPHLVADVVQTWLARGEMRPTLCFATGKLHAKALYEQFALEGVPAAYVDADTPREERERIGKAMATREVLVAVNIGTLTTGIDWDVRCIILARPTKSKMLFCQMIGRGLRTAEAKADCLARGTLVLTDKGEVPIQNVTLTHRIWDGENFVEHGGAVCKGVQRVIEHDGIVGTPDHKVMTHDGWKSLADAARDGRRIARTGFGRTPIRFADDRVAYGFWHELVIACRSRVRSMLNSAHGAISQYAEAAGNCCLLIMQSALAGVSTEMAVSTLPGAKGQVREPEKSSLFRLRRTWSSFQFSKREPCCALGGGSHRRTVAADAVGPDRQRRALRTGQPTLGASGGEHEQFTKGRRNVTCAVHRVPEGSSGREIRRSDFDEAPIYDDGSASRGAVEYAIVQAEREVWDIHNAGPLQRFTANGRLVHNCIVLDHSDTHERLGMVTDISFDLCDGKPNPKADTKKREDKTLMPKCCDKCTALMPAHEPKCLSCGNPMRLPSVFTIDGELTLYGKNRLADGLVKELRDMGITMRVAGDKLMVKAPNNYVPEVYQDQIKAHRDDLYMMHAPKQPKSESVKGELSKQPKQAIFSMLLTYADERGYKEGWAANKYREIFDVFPRGLAKHGEMPPSPMLKSWIKSQAIRWSKSSNNGGNNAAA